LGDRISGRVLPGSTNGLNQLLNDDEEEELVASLLRCASIGCRKHRKSFLVLVQAVAEHKGTQHLINGIPLLRGILILHSEPQCLVSSQSYQ